MPTSSARFIGLSVPALESDARAGLDEALAANWVAHVGPTVDAFEHELARKLGVPSSFATNSGTAALHLALCVCGVRPGDIVFCSTLTFVASASPILYCGARPAFIDAEPDSWCMSPKALARALADARARGKLPRAIIVVHLYGQSADMDALLRISDAYGVPLIEDAAEALGASYRGRPCGTLGAIGVFSFAGNKIITTSAGGALISRDPARVARARHLGMQARIGQGHYEHAELGYNYRLSNVLAGLGRSQLRVLERRVDERRAVFARYREGLAEQPQIDWMPECERGRSNRWLSVLMLDENRDCRPAQLVRALAAVEIEARRVFKPLHRQPLFRGCPYFAHGETSVSDRLFERGVCLPSSSNLSADDQARVVRELKTMLGRAMLPGHASDSSVAE